MCVLYQKFLPTPHPILQGSGDPLLKLVIVVVIPNILAWGSASVGLCQCGLTLTSSLQVYNVDPSAYNTTRYPVKVNVDMLPVMEVFLSQMR